MKKETIHGLASVIVLVCTLAGLLLGWGQDSVVRNRRVITAVGISGSTSDYTVSVQAVEALKTAANLAEQEMGATDVYSSNGQTVAAAFQNFLSSSGNRAYVLQNQLLVISEELCKQRSLFVILDYFMRNSESNPSVRVAIFRGEPADLLAVTSGSEAIAATALTQLVEEGKQWGLCFDSTLLDVERAFSGMYDVALPLIELREGTPKLNGSALFCDGKWAGTLDIPHTTGILAAGNKLNRTTWNVNGTVFELHSLKTTLQIEKQEAFVKYTFSLSGKAKLLEETAALTVQQRKTLLQQIEKELKTSMQESLQKADTARCDVLGLTRRTQQRYPNETPPFFGACPKEIKVSLRLDNNGFFLS